MRPETADTPVPPRAVAIVISYTARCGAITGSSAAPLDCTPAPAAANTTTAAPAAPLVGLKSRFAMTVFLRPEKGTSKASTFAIPYLRPILQLGECRPASAQGRRVARGKASGDW